MANTPQLALPLLDSAQAQKHVTVNEALSRLDALSPLSIKSRSLATPPTSPSEGDRYVVPGGGTGDWSGQGGKIAVWLNGGWEFVAPILGWRASIDDEAAVAVYDGADWRAGALAFATQGAATSAAMIVFDHAVGSDATSDTSVMIPDRAIVLGVTGRVTTAITGATSWRLGIASAADRYGSGIGVALNSEAHGITSAPVGYYGDTALRLSADGGLFSGGVVRLAIHLLHLTPPKTV